MLWACGCMLCRYQGAARQCGNNIVGPRAAAQVGVYALHDSKRNLQFVGYARNIVLAVRVR